MGGISGFAINVAVLVLILYFMLIGGARWKSMFTAFCLLVTRIRKTF